MRPCPTFHLHILGFAKLLLAGFLLLLLSVMVVVHVGNCCDVMFVVFVLLDLVWCRFRGEKGPGKLMGCLRMRRRGKQVEPWRLGLFYNDLGLFCSQRRGLREGGRWGSRQRNADVFARYSPNLGALMGILMLTGMGDLGSSARRPAELNPALPL